MQEEEEEKPWKGKVQNERESRFRENYLREAGGGGEGAVKGLSPERGKELVIAKFSAPGFARQMRRQMRKKKEEIWALFP